MTRDRLLVLVDDPEVARVCTELQDVTARLDELHQQQRALIRTGADLGLKKATLSRLAGVAPMTVRRWIDTKEGR